MIGARSELYSHGPLVPPVLIRCRRTAGTYRTLTGRPVFAIRGTSVQNVPDAARQDLLRFLPPELPAHLNEKPPSPKPPVEPVTPVTPELPQLPPTDRRRLVWSFVQRAPSLPAGGAEVGAATAAIDPWPHQVRAFERLYQRWPPKLLIADEVGLGKTIQAGLLLRQAWLAGRAKRILILAPKAVLKQWQIELREKFNLNWPI